MHHFTLITSYHYEESSGITRRFPVEGAQIIAVSIAEAAFLSRLMGWQYEDISVTTKGGFRIVEGN